MKMRGMIRKLLSLISHFSFFIFLLVAVPAFGQSGLTPAKAITDSNNAAVDRSNVERDAAYLPKEVDGYTKPREEGSLALRVPEDLLKKGPDFMTSPDGMVSTLQIMLILTVLTLSPAIVMMTTSSAFSWYSRSCGRRSGRRSCRRAR